MVDYQTLCFAGFAALVVYLVPRAISHRKRVNFCAKHGCKPAPSIPQKWWLFGVDNISKLTTWAEDKVFLQEMINLFKGSESRTGSMNMAGISFLLTMSPENAKAIMAS